MRVKVPASKVSLSLSFPPSLYCATLHYTKCVCVYTPLPASSSLPPSQPTATSGRLLETSELERERGRGYLPWTEPPAPAVAAVAYIRLHATLKTVKLIANLLFSRLILKQQNKCRNIKNIPLFLFVLFHFLRWTTNARTKSQSFRREKCRLCAKLLSYKFVFIYFILL